MGKRKQPELLGPWVSPSGSPGPHTPEVLAQLVGEGGKFWPCTSGCLEDVEWRVFNMYTL